MFWVDDGGNRKFGRNAVTAFRRHSLQNMEECESKSSSVSA